MVSLRSSMRCGTPWRRPARDAGLVRSMSIGQTVSENGWKGVVSMSTAMVAGLEQSTPARYEALMRISNSIRARNTESEDLFEILVRELGKVIQFDAIAQFESASKIRWHFGPVCRGPQHRPAEEDGETLPAYV